MADRLELGNKQPSLFETKTKTLTFFLNYTREEQRTPEYCDKVFFQRVLGTKQSLIHKSKLETFFPPNNLFKIYFYLLFSLILSLSQIWPSSDVPTREYPGS